MKVAETSSAKTSQIPPEEQVQNPTRTKAPAVSFSDDSFVRPPEPHLAAAKAIEEGLAKLPSEYQHNTFREGITKFFSGPGTLSQLDELKSLVSELRREIKPGIPQREPKELKDLITYKFAYDKDERSKAYRAVLVDGLAKWNEAEKNMHTYNAKENQHILNVRMANLGIK